MGKLGVIFALIGKWPNDISQSIFMSEVRKHCFGKGEVPDEYQEVQFLVEQGTSEFEEYPHELGSSVTTDAVRSQWVAIARAADVTVYANDGTWSAGKRKLLDKMLEVAGSMIVWTPSEVTEDLPEGGVSDDRPGLVVVKGSVAALAKLAAFVGIPLGGMAFGEFGTDYGDFREMG